MSALLAWAPMLVFYAITDQRDVQFWDVGEMQTVPWIYGIAHPTGFPLYTILGWIFSHAIPFGSVAWRMSFVSSLAMVAAGWFVYAIVADETGYAWIGVGSSLLFDATSIAWSRGTRADVHPLCVAFEAASFYALLRRRRTKKPDALIIALALIGAALAVHPVAVFAIPALIALAVPDLRKPRPRTIAAAVGAFLIPLLAYATIPVRSAVLFAQRRDPTLAIGMPPGRPFWDYAHTETWSNFVWFVSGAQFHREAGATGYTDGRVFATSLRLGFAVVHSEFGIPLLVIATIGLIVTARGKPSLAIALALLAVAVVPFAFAYAEEADKERYVLITLFALACLVGLGSASIVSAIALRTRRSPQTAHVALALALAGIAAWHLMNHRAIIETNRDTLARRYVEQIQARTPRDAIVIADWTYATPLAYAAYVERSLGDRIVVAGTIDTMRGYLPAWSATRCVAYVADSRKQSALATRLGYRPLNDSVPYLFARKGCGRLLQP